MKPTEQHMKVQVTTEGNILFEFKHARLLFEKAKLPELIRFLNKALDEPTDPHPEHIMD